MNITKTTRAAMLAAATSSFAALAADYTGYLSLSSAGDATWDTSSAIWVPYGGGALQRYTSGSNVVIGPDFTGTTVTPGAWLQPGNVVFDSASDIVLGVAQNNNGFGGNTVGISKRGSGKLTVASGWNYNKCPWHVYEGTLATEDKSTSTRNPFGSFTDYEPTIYVHDGAVLEDPSNNTLGSKNDTAEAEDKCVNVVVYTNGVFRPGITGSHQYPYSTVRDLVLDGGTLDASKKGSWHGGVLKVTRKLEIKGASAYTFNSVGQCWKLALASSRQTEIAVDDITGNDDADVTFDALEFGRTSQAAVAGFRKTGTGTMVYKKAISDGTDDNARGWLGINGTITVEGGALVLENAGSSFTGDIVVSGGALHAGKSGSVSAPSDLTTTSLGDLTADRKIVLDGPDARLPILCRWPFGNIACYTNEAVSAVFVVTNGATFAFGDTASVRPVTLPNLWLCDGGIAFNDGEYGVGVGMVAGTFKVTGSTPVTVAPAAGKSYQYLVVNPAMGMNAGSTLQTTFDIADVTGDAAADTTFTMPFGAPNFAMASASGQAYLDGVEVGFRKTGDGTLSLAYPRTSFGANGIGEINGTLAVETGTLDLRVAAPKATVSVSSGAALSGGDVYVKSVRIAAGGGFAAANGATTAVRATESVSFGATGFIDISTTSGTGTDFAPTVAFKIGTATVSGMANLANWTVRVNGRALNPGQASIRLRDDGSIVAKKTEATFLYVR